MGVIHKAEDVVLGDDQEMAVSCARITILTRIYCTKFYNLSQSALG